MRIVYVAAVMASMCSTTVTAVDYAWWVTAKFEATDEVIETIRVRELDPHWITASPLRETHISSKASAPGESLQDHGAAFQREGDFNRDGKTDKAIVGVYRTTAGEQGGFLLIITRNTHGAWTKQALFKNPGGNFSAI